MGIKGTIKKYNSRKPFNLLSMIAISISICSIPLHPIISSFFLYYRECLAVFNMICAVLIVLFGCEIRILREPIIKWVMFWVIYITASFLFVESRSIYGEPIEMASQRLYSLSPELYVFGVYLLYVPMFILLSVRGLTENQLKSILIVLVILSPILLIYQFRFYLDNIYSLVSYVMFYGGRTHYNDLPTFYTFVFAACLYLLSGKLRTLIRALIVLSMIVSIVYITISTSRQSFFFSFLTLVTYLAMRRISLTRSILIVIVVFIIPIFILNMILSAEQKTRVVQRYFTAEIFESDRSRIITEGLQSLSTVREWIFGRGLASVVYAGPHSNYLRSIQRTGLIGALLLYFPFILSFKNALNSLRTMRKQVPNDGKDNDLLSLLWLIVIGLAFTLYHSLFSYPTDEAINAPIVWAMIGIWVAMKPIFTYKVKRKN